MPLRDLTCCLRRCLQLHSEAAWAVSFPHCGRPRLDAVFSCSVWEAWLGLGIAACWLWEFKQLSCSEVWAASREPFWVSASLGHCCSAWTTPQTWVAFAFLDQVFSNVLAALDPVPRCGVEQARPGCLLSSDWGVKWQLLEETSGCSDYWHTSLCALSHI